MKKILLTLLSLAICTSAFSDETREARRCRRGLNAGYASRDATVLSMVGWGFGIAIGIAAICALIDNERAAVAGGGGTNPVH